MARFIIQKPSSSGVDKRLKIVKTIGLSSLKKTGNRVFTGEIAPEELVDQAKNIFSKSRVTTLLGSFVKKERPKYITKYGAEVTDYVALTSKNTIRTTGKDGIISVEEVVEEFVDLSAMVNVSVKKNIVLTDVMGRDFSRKEYVSGGDYMVNIKGKIVGDYPDVYPGEEVSKLIRMLSSSGILTVDCPLLTRFNITGLYVLSYNIPQSTGSSNMQEYSISAVYEQPIEALVVNNTKKEKDLQKIMSELNEWIAIDTFLNTSI